MSYAWAVWWKKALNANWELVQFSDNPAMTASLLSGQIDCAVNSSQSFQAGLDAGRLHLLADPQRPSTFPASFPTGILGGSLWGMKDNLKAKQDAIVRFMRAYLKGADWILNNSSTDVATLLRKNPDWATVQQQTVVKDFDNVRALLYPHHGYIAASSWPSVLEFAVVSGQSFIRPSDPMWSYARRVDMSYFKAAGGPVT
jgi:ABC-type nitrate/sulfonate/bicarbonate transport system substrate-binding protein